jgi:hypothetical protein
MTLETLRLLRCHVCRYWYRPASSRFHCPACSASSVRILYRGRVVNIDTSNGKPLARGFPSLNITRKRELQIAQALHRY